MFSFCCKEKKRFRMEKRKKEKKKENYIQGEYHRVKGSCSFGALEVVVEEDPVVLRIVEVTPEVESLEQSGRIEQMVKECQGVVM